MEPHRGRGRLGLRDVRLDTCFGAFGFGRAYIYVCVFIVTDPPTDFMRDTGTHPSLGACGRCICPLGVLPGSKRIPNSRICESSLPNPIFSVSARLPSFRPKQNLPVSSLFSSESSMQVWR